MAPAMMKAKITCGRGGIQSIGFAGTDGRRGWAVVVVGGTGVG